MILICESYVLLRILEQDNAQKSKDVKAMLYFDKLYSHKSLNRLAPLALWL